MVGQRFRFQAGFLEIVILFCGTVWCFVRLACLSSTQEVPMDMSFLIAILPLITLVSAGIFALVSTRHVDHRYAVVSSSGPSLARNIRGKGAFEALERADLSGQRGTICD